MGYSYLLYSLSLAAFALLTSEPLLPAITPILTN